MVKKVRGLEIKQEVAEVAKEVVKVAKEVAEVAKEVVEMAKKLIRVVKEVVEVTERIEVVVESLTLLLSSLSSYDNVINENNQGNVRNMNNGRGGCSYKEFMACNPKDYDGKGDAIVYTRCIEKMELMYKGLKTEQKRPRGHTWLTRGHTWLTRGSMWHPDPTIDQRSTTVYRSLTAAIDPRWPPLTASVDRFSTRYVRGSDMTGSLAEGSVPGKDPEGSGRLTCHDVSGGSLAVTRLLALFSKGKIELIKSSTDLKYSMPIDQPLHCTDVLGDTIVDIDLLLGEHLDTLSTEDREIDFNPIRDIEELERLLADDPVPVPRAFDEPLGHSDLISRSFDVTFSNPLFDFNDDSILCYDNPLFDEEFEDISSLDPPESTLVIDVSFLPVPPLLDPKQTCLRDVERFDPFFSLTQSVEYDVGDGETFIVISIWPSPRPAAIYSPKVAMYCYYPPHSLRVMVRPWS
ncbi:hypothetical protein Tco_0891476 [Tanacetum coccineum]|uniref:Uncharacterized protein n=1 Tax=Tanacetum coccineum TaxID=301880 RepID=A0ABQ5C8I0_9ASTR